MPKIRRFLFQLLLACLAPFAAGPVLAEVGPWQEVPNGQVRLLSHSAEEGQDTALGIEVALDEGWKIYWEYAGPVGQPTLIEAANLAEGQSATFFFPWPKRDRLQGFPSYGYGGTVLFPGVLSGASRGGEIRLGLSICSETQCIPHRTSLDVPKDVVGPDLLLRSKLSRAFQAIPIPSDQTPIVIPNLDRSEISLFDFQVPSPSDFLIAADGTAARRGFFLNIPGPGSEDDLLVATYDLRDPEEGLGFLDNSRVFARGEAGAFVYDTRDLPAYNQLALILDAEPVEARGVPVLQFTSNAQEQNALGFSSTLVGAAIFLFIGGLLLNVMPCVLPVLFLKMKAALTLDQGDRLAALRRSFGWTAAGMVGTFLVLGLVLALVQQATGLQLTLGAWLQFPITTVVLAALVTLFIANAFGWFDFIIPSSVASMGAQRQGAFGDVLAGVVAALLGGACAGILLAVALGVAFSQPPLLMVILLGIMGLGLALPYLLVALVPGAARLIPKPGPWMSWLKPIMGIGLGLTLGYLVFISTKQLQLGAVIALALISLIALGTLWSNRKRAGVGGLALMVLILPFFALPPDPVEMSRDYGAEIDALVANGERVLVDVTAFWCATCQTNKLWVLDTQEVQDLFEETGTQVFTINADTLAENISEFMADQGRSSLPLNILFSPAVPEGEILPSVLTKASVREAVERTL